LSTNFIKYTKIWYKNKISQIAHNGPGYEYFRRASDERSERKAELLNFASTHHADTSTAKYLLAYYCFFI